MLGVYLSSSPFDPIPADTMAKLYTAEELMLLPRGIYPVAAIVTAARNDPKGRDFGFVTFATPSGDLSVIVWAKLWAEIRPVLRKGSLVFITVEKSGEDRYRLESVRSYHAARRRAMPSRSGPSARALTKFETDFKKRFGENTITTRRKYRVVSTGSLALDYAMGCGGYVVGRITEIWGVESSAKTTLAMMAAANFQREFSDRNIAWLDMERTFDYDWAAAQGIDARRITLLSPQDSEDVADMTKMAIRSGLFALLVLDSVGGMVTAEEMDKNAEDVRSAPPPR